MINHARTLLYNEDGNYRTVLPGEEFIPDEFRKKTLPAFLTAGMRALFGAAPDRLFKNYRTWQLMQWLHQTEVEEYVLALDPRITYQRDGDDEFFTTAWQTTAAQIVGFGYPLYVTGEHLADEGLGVSAQEWILTVTPTGMMVRRTVAPTSTVTLAYTVSQGLSSEIALPGTGLSVRHHDAPVGTSWIVKSSARPQMDFGEVLARFIRVMSGFQSELFTHNPQEPFLTFRNLFQLHPTTPYSSAGLLMAFIYRLDQVAAEKLHG